jgi:hypothetical protein
MRLHEASSHTSQVGRLNTPRVDVCLPEIATCLQTDLFLYLSHAKAESSTSLSLSSLTFYSKNKNLNARSNDKKTRSVLQVSHSLPPEPWHNQEQTARSTTKSDDC